MPITSTDIQYRLSGGSANASGNASIGGAMSATAVNSSANSLFDYVSGDEAAAGMTDYRCIYVLNNHASLTLFGALVWINSNTPSPQTSAQIGLGTAAVGIAETATGNTATAPSGVTFADAANSGSALAIGDIPAGSFKSVWIKRVVAAGAIAYNNDGLSLTVQGDTGA